VSLAVGSRLGAYEILAPIGAGGMGEVYRARDGKLGRDVAIKVLPDRVASDPEALARFEREARATAALSHPNILAIHDFGRQDGLAYAVTELLEGETLRERLSAGPLPARKGIDVAVQVAHGLAAAHDRGIVHRDLKPENLFLTRDGHVKILDFGLARRVDALADDTEAPTPPHTEPGAVLGTVGYMSPEQVRGEGADHRSDVFSFGVVVYEMLAGTRPFRGASAVEAMSAILKEDPAPPSQVREGVSPEVDRVVLHCLEKRPEDRFQSARDLVFDLGPLGTLSGRGTAGPRADHRVGARTTRAAVLLATLAAAFLAGWFGRARHPGRESPLLASFAQLSDHPGVEEWPSLAPDGKSVVYMSRASGNADVYLQRVGSGVALNLTRDFAGEDTEPTFSPDGERIAFRSEREGGGIFVMGTSGESVRRLSDSGYAPSWSPDGKELVVSTVKFEDPLNRRGQGQLWAIDTAAGSRRPILAVGDAVQPAWSPHGGRIAYWGLTGNGGQRDLYTVAANGSESRRGGVPVTQDRPVDWSPAWSPDGRYLLFASDRGGSMNLWRIPIEEPSGRVRGEPEALTVPASWAGRPAVSRDDRRVAFATLDWRSSLQKVPFDPRRGVHTGPPERLLSSTQPIRDHEVSPDGQWIVYARAGTREDVFVARIDGSAYRRLTDDVFRNRSPAWSPDGQRIAFYSDRGGEYEVWTIRPDGSGLQQLTRTGGQADSPVWAPDATRIAFGSGGAGADWRLVSATSPSDPRIDEALPPLADGTSFSPASWTQDGNWLLGFRMSSTGAITGIVRYGIADRRYDVVYEDPVGAAFGIVALADGRRALARDRNGIFLLDTATRQTRRLLAVKGQFEAKSLGLTRDERWITFTETAGEGDIWVAALRP